MDHHDMWFLTSVPNFSSLPWLEVCWEPPVLEVHTWRMLMVTDWVFWWGGHPWHHGLSWYVVPNLCAKFQLSSMIRSVSRTPHPWNPYLEEVDGSWLGTWRMGSSLLSWIIMICDSWLVCQISTLAWKKVCQELPLLKVILGWHWCFLTGYLEDGVILDIMDCHDMWFLTCVPNFSSLAWIEVCQEPPVLEVILGGRWWFLTGYLEDGVILDMLDHLERPPGTYPESFLKIWLNLAKL